jgi:hypothetical protein
MVEETKKYMVVGTKTYLFMRTNLWLWEQKSMVVGSKQWLCKQKI